MGPKPMPNSMVAMILKHAAMTKHVTIDHLLQKLNYKGLIKQ